MRELLAFTLPPDWHKHIRLQTLQSEAGYLQRLVREQESFIPPLDDSQLLFHIPHRKSFLVNDM